MKYYVKPRIAWPIEGPALFIRFDGLCTRPGNSHIIYEEDVIKASFFESRQEIEELIGRTGFTRSKFIIESIAGTDLFLKLLQ